MNLRNLAPAVLGILLTGTLATATATATASDRGPDFPRRIHLTKGGTVTAAGTPAATPSPGQLMTAHGGPVLAQTNIRIVYAGPSWTNPTLVGDKMTGLDAFFGGYGNSSYSNTAAEYAGSNGSVGATVNYQGHGTPIATSISGDSTPAVTAAVCNEYAANVASMPNPQSELIYVFSDMKRPSSSNYCAYHSATTCSGQTLQYGFFWNLDGDPGCNPNDTSGLHSQGLSALANVAAHETQEARTDPELNAWFDSSGNEIGDKCAWTFGPSTVTFTNGSQWKLQGEWSNSAYNQQSGFGSNAGCIDHSLTPSTGGPTVTNTVSCAAIGAGLSESCTGTITVTAQTSALTLAAAPFTSSNTSGEFKFTGGTCTANQSLAQNASCNLGTVAFTPQATGTRSTSVTVFTSNGNASTAVTGTGLAGTPALSASSVNCGSVAVGAQAVCGTSGITVKAVGGPIVLGTQPLANSDAVDFSVGAGSCTAGATLALNQTCTLGTIAFNPTSTGQKSASVTLQFVGASATLALQGTGTTSTVPGGKPVLSIQNGPLQCPSTGVGSTANCTGTVVVTASGGSIELSATPIALSNGTEFSVASGTCTPNLFLARYAFCTLGTVSFTPSAAGARSTQLSVSSTGGSATQSITGTGTVGTLSVSATAVNCGSAAVGTSANCQPGSILVTATGGPVTLGSTPLVSLNAAEFSVPTGNCTAGKVLTAGQNCSTGTPVFTPNGTGARTSTLTVNGTVSSAKVSLSGTGTPVVVPPGAPLFASAPGSITCPASAAGGTVNCSGTLQFKASGGPLTLSANPVQVSNASFKIGSSTCTPNGALAANATCQLGNITYTASNTASPSAQVTVVTNNGSASTSISAGVAAGTVSVSPNTINCGTATVGTTAVCGVPSFLVTANGGPVTLSSTPITNSNTNEFSISGSNCSPGLTLNAGQSCTVGPIGYSPQGTGTRGATVNVQTTNGGASLTLSATGTTVPSVSGVPVITNTTTCPMIGVGTTGVCTGALTLTASGGPITVAGSTILATTGSGLSTDFAPGQGNCPKNGVLAANTTCNLGLPTFAPTQVGVRLAMLTVSTSVGTAATPLVGVGEPGFVTVNAQTLNCGPVPAGHSAPCGNGTLVLTANGGPVTLTAQPFQLADARDFSVVNGGCAPGITLNAGQSCTTGPITFSPATSGNVAAPLYVQATYSGAIVWLSASATAGTTHEDVRTPDEAGERLAGEHTRR